MRKKLELSDPPYYVIYRDQRRRRMRIDAQFRRLADATRYVRAYRTLKKHELVTVERICEEDPNKIHLIFSACHKEMDVAITDDGPRAMAPEIALAYEQWGERP